MKKILSFLITFTLLFTNILNISANDSMNILYEETLTDGPLTATLKIIDTGASIIAQYEVDLPEDSEYADDVVFALTNDKTRGNNTTTNTDYWSTILPEGTNNFYVCYGEITYPSHDSKYRVDFEPYTVELDKERNNVKTSIYLADLNFFNENVENYHKDFQLNNENSNIYVKKDSYHARLNLFTTHNLTSTDDLTIYLQRENEELIELPNFEVSNNKIYITRSIQLPVVEGLNTFIVKKDTVKTLDGEYIDYDMEFSVNIFFNKEIDETPVEVVKYNGTVLVNENEYNIGAYNINGNNFFKLRDVAYFLSEEGISMDILWNAETELITVDKTNSYSSEFSEVELPEFAVATPNVVLVNVVSEESENPKLLQFIAYNINGNNYFKLRDLGSELNFNVDWNEELRQIEISE